MRGQVVATCPRPMWLLMHCMVVLPFEPARQTDSVLLVPLTSLPLPPLPPLLPPFSLHAMVFSTFPPSLSSPLSSVSSYLAIISSLPSACRMSGCLKARLRPCSAPSSKQQQMRMLAHMLTVILRAARASLLMEEQAARVLLPLSQVHRQ